MTKTFKLIGMVLVAVLMSVGFAACSSDDDDEQEQTKTTGIVGTTWSGSNSSMGYTVIVYIKNATKCEVTVSGSKEECSYTYSESTGKFVCQHSAGTITGTISGSKMTVTDSYGTYTLTKQ